MSEAGHAESSEVRVRRAPTAELTTSELRAIRELLWAAFAAEGDGMTEDDWQHGLAGCTFFSTFRARSPATPPWSSATSTWAIEHSGPDTLRPSRRRRFDRVGGWARGSSPT